MFIVYNLITYEYVRIKSIEETVHCLSLFVFVSVLLSPLMELPPLSPGIHDNVIDVVVVLVTVRRG